MKRNGYLTFQYVIDHSIEHSDHMRGAIPSFDAVCAGSLFTTTLN